MGGLGGLGGLGGVGCGERQAPGAPVTCNVYDLSWGGDEKDGKKKKARPANKNLPVLKDVLKDVSVLKGEEKKARPQAPPALPPPHSTHARLWIRTRPLLRKGVNRRSAVLRRGE